MKKKLFVVWLAAMCFAPTDCYAQTYVQSLVEAVGSPTDFEGEITVTSIQTSTGTRLGDKLSYDGKHIDRKWLKNGNMHLFDTRMHIHYIANREENRCIVYSDETESGVEYPLDKRPEIQPWNIAAVDPRVTSIGMTVDTSSVYSNKMESVMGLKCEASKNRYVSHYETALASEASGQSETDVETWRCVDPKYQGMILKQVMDMKYNYRAITTSKSTTYFSASVTEIKEQSVSDDEFQAPSGYKILKVRTFYTAQNKLKEVFKETEKQLKKKKQHPSQLEDNDTFETEGEWED